MLDSFLVPPATVITAKGDGAGLDISSAESRMFVLTLAISSVVEQESLELSLFTSGDGTVWDSKPVATLPQKFYLGEYPLLVDLSANPEAKFVRAHWEVNRWGRGPTTPRFEIGVRFRELPAELLREIRAESASQR